MRIGNAIIISTVDGDSRIVRTNGREVDEIIADVKEMILDMYHEGDVCLEEFIECGELQIDGLPMNLQVQLFTRLKKEIDGDEIYIEGYDGAFPSMKLSDYLESGPVIPQEGD